MKPIYTRCWLVMLALVAGLAACSEPMDPRAEVEAFLAKGEGLVENRDILGTLALISPDYQDPRGNDQAAIKRLLLGYFMRNKAIHLFVQIETIDLPLPDQARVVLLAGMAGRPVEGLEGFLNLRADLYRFYLDLGKPDAEWVLVSMEWEPANR